MTYVVPFKRFRPGSRDDGIPFTSVEVMESETEDGLYVLIDTFSMDPVDTDPEHPAYRDFTTTLALHADGWYKIVFVDDLGNRQESDPIHHTNIAGIYYTTFDAVRDYLDVTDEQLSDEMLTQPIKRAQRDIDFGVGSWAVFSDTGLKFATDDDDLNPVLDDAETEALSLATCAQVEYRMTMGEDFMVKEQYDSQSGPGYSAQGKLRKLSSSSYAYLAQAGLLRLHGKASNRGLSRFGDLPRAN